MAVNKNTKWGKLQGILFSKPVHVLSKAETVFYDTSNEENSKFYVIIYANCLLLSRGQENWFDDNDDMTQIQLKEKQNAFQEWSLPWLDSITSKLTYRKLWHAV